MLPGMVHCIISTDPDFVIDMTDLLRSRQAEVYVATSIDEYDRIQREGVVVEMLVLDPVFRMA